MLCWFRLILTRIVLLIQVLFGPKCSADQSFCGPKTFCWHVQCSQIQILSPSWRAKRVFTCKPCKEIPQALQKDRNARNHAFYSVSCLPVSGRHPEHQVTNTKKKIYECRNVLSISCALLCNSIREIEGILTWQSIYAGRHSSFFRGFCTLLCNSALEIEKELIVKSHEFSRHVVSYHGPRACLCTCVRARLRKKICWQQDSDYESAHALQAKERQALCRKQEQTAY